ncbi:hypothetical protein [Bacillus sp. F9_6S_D1_P_5]
MSNYQIIRTELINAFDSHLAPFSRKLNFTYHIVPNDCNIGIEGKAQDIFNMFALSISDEFEQIYIDTAFLPSKIKGNGIVLRLMEITFLIGQKHGYDTVVVNMVDGFYRALRNRGALETYKPNGTESYEDLILTNTTNFKK